MRFSKIDLFIMSCLGMVGVVFDNATGIAFLFQCVGVVIGCSRLVRIILERIKNKQFEFKLNFSNCSKILFFSIVGIYFSGAPYIGAKSLEAASDIRSTIGFLLGLAIGIGLIYLFWRTSKIIWSSNNRIEDGSEGV